MSDYYNINDGIDKVKKEFSIKLPLKKRKLIPLIAIGLAIPLTVVLALSQTNILKFAGGGPMIAEVRVSPGSIDAKLPDFDIALQGTGQAKEIHLSALAYDEYGLPIYQYPVSFEWSLSSGNSIGSLSRTQGDLTDFKPIKEGCGQLTVTAKNGDNIVTKSISVVVLSDIIPDCAINVPSPTPIAQDYNRVFVTSTTHNGNLGGLTGADNTCQARADVAGLGGKWKAWLSDGNISASSRLIHSESPYVLLNGRNIADNWKDLTESYGLDFPFEITEFNQRVASNAWTNTFGNGEIKYPDKSCKNWTSIASSDVGGMGLVSNVGVWTDYGAQYCFAKLRLYCIEQISSNEPKPTVAPTITLVPPSPTLVPPTPTSTTTIRATIEPEADAFVRSSAPNSNFGTSVKLKNDQVPNEISYLRFNLRALAGKTIKSAKLVLRVSDATSSTLTLRRISDANWGERTITYNNRPGNAAVIRTFNAKTLNSKVMLDVKNAVDLKKGGKVTFGITSGSNDSGAFYSRESSILNKPQLIVEYQ